MATESKHYNVAILGAGPAGLTSAIYTSRAGLSTIVIDESSAGGQVKSTHQVANYPGFVEPISGYELSNNMKEQATRYGTKFSLVSDITNIALNEKKTIEIDGKDQISADYVIIATGRSPRKLGLPGEAEYKGQGISYCATCDGEFYKDKEVFVIGGGNSAIQESFLLLKYVKKLTIIHQFDVLQAEKVTAEKIMNHPKVEIYWSHEPRAFFKENDDSVTVELENLKTKEHFNLTRDGVFIFVGMVPNSNLLKDTGVKINDYGYIPTDDLMESNIENVYAVGDIRDKKTWQITVAVGEGTIAALEIVKKSI